MQITPQNARHIQMMTRLELVVRQTVANELGLDGPNAVQLDCRMTEDLQADSLDRLALQLQIEQTLDIEIPFDDGENMHTVRDIVDYLEARYRV